MSNGIKMTAMPAFGPTHDEATIWNIVAFVEQLPAIWEELIAALVDGGCLHGAAAVQALSARRQSGRRPPLSEVGAAIVTLSTVVKSPQYLWRLAWLP